MLVVYSLEDGRFYMVVDRFGKGWRKYKNVTHDSVWRMITLTRQPGWKVSATAVGWIAKRYN